MSYYVDFEQLTFDEIETSIETKPDYWKPELLLIPFGKTGRGEWYAFYYDLNDNENIPIVLLETGLNGVVLAKNIEDFMFRMILETACTNFYNEELYDNEIVFRNNIIRMIQSHRKYLTIEQKLILDDTFGKPMKKISATETGMISEEEMNNYFRETIDFKNFNLEFEYCLD